MCGRYTLATVDADALAARFSMSEPPPEETVGRCNVCPTETIAVAGAPQPALRWGLRPFRNGGPAPINARSETAATNGIFRRLERCLVLADGWYEWLKAERPGGARLPFRYTVDDGAPFAFAGLRDREAAIILTTTANAVCAPLHDRMPCVLASPEAEAAWLDGDLAPAELAALEDARVAVAPANPAVNKAGVEGVELLSAP